MRYLCRTIAATNKLRVIQATEQHAGREELYESAFARWLPTGRITPLGDHQGGVGNSTTLLPVGVIVAGRFLGYGVGLEAERYPGTGFSEAVERLNSQTGRREQIPCNGAKGNGVGEKSPGVTDIVVTPAGSIAWILDGSFSDPTNKTPAPGVVPLGSKAIYEVPPNSKTAMLVAFSSNIQPKSLAAIPGHLYWTEGGQPREAKTE